MERKTLLSVSTDKFIYISQKMINTIISALFNFTLKEKKMKWNMLTVKQTQKILEILL